ncbi:MAG: bifunctional folylpolyglutamate synthase/dihydrofolate synthase [bacterium]|nr:bifunctional folylpolyglutamate synthase/dihydrofolate synthase [bacterium]
MNYQEAISYLYSLEQFGIKFGLHNIQRMMELLGNPQETLRAIHIAGTNGKGSVAAYCASILTSAGYKVGLYTSPHLVKFEERMQINGKQITESELVRFVEKIQPIAKQVADDNQGLHPTFFEVTTAIALDYFAQNNVEYLVLEVGMGGRLDATNVVSAKVAVITNITFDHMQYLGDTLAKIAYEKAGIIKPHAIVITGAAGEALTEIQRVCAERTAELIVYPKDIAYQEDLNEFDTRRFTIATVNNVYPHLEIPLRGKHQLVNATLAVAGIEAMESAYGCDCRSAIAEGLKKTVWPGRLEVVRQEPMIVLDGAHNVAGIESLTSALLDEFNYENLYLIIGIANDKESRKMLELLCPLAKEVILTAAKTHRAIPPETLSTQINATDTFALKSNPPRITIVKHIPDAIQYALQLADRNDLICITGSLYVVGEAREQLMK